MREKYLWRELFSRSVTTSISITGALLLLWAIIEPLYLFSLDSPTIFQHRYMIGYFTILPSCIGMIWGSRWLRRGSIPVDQHSKIGVYWLIGGCGFLVFNIGLMIFFPIDSIWIMLNWVRWALTLGLAVGLVIGILQARAIFSRLTAERQSLQAKHAEQQRDLIDQMNGILRHEVLNSTQVITGNASLLLDSNEPIEPTDERLRRIYRQGKEVTRVIEEVRLLLPTVENTRELETVDLTSVVETEVQKINDQWPDVDTSLRCQDDIRIQGDELLGRIFANILRNTVEHNDTASMQITVDVETVDQSAVITIEDTGGGIPERKLDTLFNRPQVGDNGLGLYLVKELTKSYDGTIELLRTGNNGTTFELRFPVSETAV